MAKDTDWNVALLAIHPNYADAIFSLEKRVEFRKTVFRRTVAQVVVYATAPVQRVLGYFDVVRTIQASPHRLWVKYRSCGGISKRAFDEYYAGRDQGVAIEVGRVRRLQRPIELNQLRRGLKAPQSYCYLDHRVVVRMAQEMNG